MFFLIVSGLIIPVIMIIIGVIFREKPPAKINSIAGYRTRRSMLSQEAWIFANKYSGRLFLSYGLASFSATCVILFLLRHQDSDLMGAAVAVLCIIQTAVIIFTIFPVEKALKEKFDDQGRPRA